MRNPPPEVRASWPAPNYDNPETKGKALEVVEITLMVISVLVVAARVYCRHFLLYNMGVDDWLVVASLVPTLGLTIATIVGVKQGWGIHIWDIKPERNEGILLTSWIAQFLFVIAVAMSKLSIVWTYSRLSPNKIFRNILIGTGAVIIIYGIVFTCTNIFRCKPLSTYWSVDPNYRDTCMNESKPLLATVIINILTDFWCVALPLPVLWKLQIPRRQRFALMVLMSLGLLACAAGIIRLHYLIITLFRTYDVTWYGYSTWLWTSVEVQLGIICSSVPLLRPLIRRYFPVLTGKVSEINSAGTIRKSTVAAPPGFQMLNSPSSMQSMKREFPGAVV